MSNSEDIVKDIYGMFEAVHSGTTPEHSSEAITNLGARVAIAVQRALTAREKKREDKTLYFSEIGKPCHRQLWFDYHGFDKEPLQPQALIKFLYGDILEALVLYLAEQAGHKVEDEQKVCELVLKNGWKVRGRMDARIDGEIVDVKSASTFSFNKKFAANAVHEDDAFGYMGQLGGYVATDHPMGKPYEVIASFLAIDKTLGKLVRTPYSFSDKDRDELLERLAKLTEMLDDSKKPPKRGFLPVPIGKSGNEGLGVSCSYCSHKKRCWEDANNNTGLRTFLYENGPVHLTKVAREPKVPELLSDGTLRNPK